MSWWAFIIVVIRVGDPITMRYCIIVQFPHLKKGVQVEFEMVVILPTVIPVDTIILSLKENNNKNCTEWQFLGKITILLN